MSSRPFGTTEAGDAVECWTLQQGSAEVDVLTLGCTRCAHRRDLRSRDTGSPEQRWSQMAAVLRELDLVGAGAS